MGWRCVVCMEEQPPSAACRDCGCASSLSSGGGPPSLLSLVSSLLHSPPDPTRGLSFLAAHGLGSEALLQAAVDGAGAPRVGAGSPPVRARAGAPPCAPAPRFGLAPPPRVGVAFDERMCGHGCAASAERPDRLRAAAGVLAGLGLLQACVRLGVPEPAPGAPLLSGADVGRACGAAHGAALAGWERDAGGLAEGALAAAPCGDVDLTRGTPLAARLAVAAVCEGVRAAARGVVDRALCLVRPPGHHASAERSGGFCVLNNVGAAVRGALEEERLSRVMVVDLDVHHGNGTEALFEGDGRVLTFSLHRYDGGAFYPGTGHPGVGGAAGAGAGLAVSVGVDGSWHGDAEVAAVVERLLAPLARAFDPELVVVSLGLDGGRGDPIGDWDVTPAGFALAVHALCALGAPVVVALEGGYHLRAVSASLSAVARVLLGEAPEPLSAGEVGVPVLPERAVLEGGDAGVYYGSPESDAPPDVKAAAAADRAHAHRLLEAGRKWRAALGGTANGAAPPHPGRAMGPRPAALAAIAATQAALKASGRWPGLF